MAEGGVTDRLSRADAARNREEYWRGVFAEQRRSEMNC